MTNEDKDVANKRAVFGIEKFAHQKGVAKGLKQFHERKEKKRLETARSLRTYKKAMKKEGFEPGTGASRKRKHTSNEDPQKDAGNGAEEPTGTNNPSTNSTTKPAHKKQNNGSEFYKASHQSNQRQRRNEDRESQIKAKERDRKQALRQRRQRHERLSARTKKGQPVMKNIVHDILHKLQREKKAASESK